MTTPDRNLFWSPTVRWFGATLAAIGIAWLFYVSSPLIESLVIAALLAYILDPVVHVLVRGTRLNHALSALLVYLTFLLALLSIPALLGTLVIGQFHRLENNLLTALTEMQLLLGRPINFLGYHFEPQVALNYLAETSGNTFAAIPSGSLGILGGVTANLFWGLVTLVSLYYFLKDGHKIKQFLVNLAPIDYQHDAERLLNEINRAWGIFLRVQLVIFLILALLLLIGSMLMIWLFQIGLLPLSTIGLVIVLAAFYTLVQQVDNLWLRPRLIGQRMRLHPGLVFVVLLGALALGGVLAAIVAVPGIVTLKILLRYYQRRMQGLPPWPEEELTPDETDETAEGQAIEDQQQAEQDTPISMTRQPGEPS